MAYIISHFTDAPSGWKDQCEVADYMEIRCLADECGTYSANSACSNGNMSYENDEMEEEEDTIIDHDDKIHEYIVEALNTEVEQRKAKSNENYPFATDGDRITRIDDMAEPIKEVYTFLLLCTRLRMGGTGCNRTHEGYDGTQLFEQLCAKVLMKYYGENSESFVFGTGADGDVTSFKDKLKDMFDLIGERGGGASDVINKRQKDGGVDVVLYIPFADKRHGKFIAFAQCKTGQGWRGQISMCNPDIFMKEFFQQYPTTFTPITIFMVAESFNDYWERTQFSSRGFLFDRSRIMQYLPDMNSEDNAELYEKIKLWNKGAMISIGIER